MKFTIKQGISKFFLVAVTGAVVAACGSNPTYDMTPAEIAQHLGYSGAAQVTDVPLPATFDLREVNLRTAIMAARFGREYLIVFGHNCPAAASDADLNTTATGGVLEVGDSIISGEVDYCQIAEIYVVE